MPFDSFSFVPHRNSLSPVGTPPLPAWTHQICSTECPRGTVLVLRVGDELSYMALPVRSHDGSSCTTANTVARRGRRHREGAWQDGGEDVEDDGELGVKVAKGGSKMGSLVQRLIRGGPIFSLSTS